MIDFKMICILYSAQEAKIASEWRGARKLSRCSTRQATALSSTRTVQRGPYWKRISLEFLITVGPQTPSVQVSNCFCRLSYNQIGGIYRDNPTGVPLTWKWDICQGQESIIKTVYTVRLSICPCLFNQFLKRFVSQVFLIYRSIYFSLEMSAIFLLKFVAVRKIFYAHFRVNITCIRNWSICDNI